MSRFVTGARVMVGMVGMVGLFGASGCGQALPESSERAERAGPVEQTAPTPDARLVTHAFEPSTPTAAGLAFVEKIAAVHTRADEASDDETRVEILEEGLELEAPDHMAEAEVLQLELAARLCETRLALGRAEDARDELADMLDPTRSLPLDRASAHALTVLGDAAAATGDDALAAGSYARAVRMMSLLADDLAEKAGVGELHRAPSPDDAVDGGAR